MKQIETGVFSSAYAGSVRYYAAMLACRNVLVYSSEHRHKTPWCAHHCRVVGANGEQTLTLPLVRPADGMSQPLNRVEISEHGDWRRTHWGAIFSAYGKSPFFEYIADDLRAIYENHELKNLFDFNTAIHSLIVDFLDLPVDIRFIDEIPDEAIDFRGKTGGAKADRLDFVQDIPYWQVWQERHGFNPDLSILDLLMCHGRESIFILQDMLK